jgi:hypothetical protein
MAKANAKARRNDSDAAQDDIPRQEAPAPWRAVRRARTLSHGLTDVVDVEEALIEKTASQSDKQAGGLSIRSRILQPFPTRSPSRRRSKAATDHDATSANHPRKLRPRQSNPHTSANIFPPSEPLPSPISIQ